MPNFKLKLEGKYWYINYAEGRRSVHYSTRQTDKKLAKQVFDNFVREYHTPQEADPADMPIDVVMRRYLDDKRGELAGVDTNERTVAHLIEYHGTEPVSSLTAGTHKDYETDRRKFGWSNATINRTRNVLRAALKHAVKDGKLHHAPFVPSLKVAKGKYRWLSREEVKWLYRALLPKRLRHLSLFVRIALATGARMSAILQLTWDRVDLETGRIDFRDPDMAETNKRRPHAPINDQLLRLLRAARKVSEGDYVVMRHGKPIKSIKKGFAEVCKTAKIKGATPHTLKHTCITWLLRADVQIWQVAGLTNTSPATITHVYGHHATDDLKTAANAILRPSARIVPESKEKGL